MDEKTVDRIIELMRPGLIVARNGERREVNATDGELELFGIVRDLSPVDVRDRLELVRKSDGYVTVMLGEWDIVRLKYTDRAKWVVFPVIEAKAKKHYIDEPESLLDMSEFILDTIERIEKYDK